MANQGGTHDQHVKAGQQSHKKTGGQEASSSSDNKQAGDNRSHEQQSKAGQQSHKKSH